MSSFLVKLLIFTTCVGFTLTINTCTCRREGHVNCYCVKYLHCDENGYIKTDIDVTDNDLNAVPRYVVKFLANAGGFVSFKR